MSHLSMHDIDQMSMEQMLRRLEELREELLQLRAQQALGGSSSNPGEFKQTRRSIARPVSYTHLTLPTNREV